MDEDSATSAQTKEHVFLSWTQSAERGFRLQGLAVGGHDILDSLSIPADLGEPIVRGAALGFAEPPDPVHLRVWDNKPSLFQLSCGDLSPPDPVLPPNPCVLAFPEGHVVEVVRSGGMKHEILVSTVEERAIVPCVRLFVDGEVQVDGLVLTLFGSLNAKLQAPPDPVAPGEIDPIDR